MEGYITVKDIIEKYDIGKVGLYAAIKKKRLNAIKVKDKLTNHRFKYFFNEKDVEDYFKNRWSRDFSKVDGKNLYDEKEGRYSVKKVAGKLNTNIARVYFLIYSGKLKCYRVKGQYVIFERDMVEYLASLG